MRKMMVVDEVDCMRHVLRHAICYRVIDCRESIDGPRHEDGRSSWGNEKHSSSIC
jgi:hypothetical protein